MVLQVRIEVVKSPLGLEIGKTPQTYFFKVEGAGFSVVVASKIRINVLMTARTTIHHNCRVNSNKYSYM